jgi:hypothetical protein
MYLRNTATVYALCFIRPRIKNQTDEETRERVWRDYFLFKPNIRSLHSAPAFEWLNYRTIREDVFPKLRLFADFLCIIKWLSKKSSEAAMSGEARSAPFCLLIILKYGRAQRTGAAKTMPKISVGNFFQLSGSLRHHKPNHVVHFSQDTYDMFQLLEKPALCRRTFQCQQRLQGHGS